VSDSRRSAAVPADQPGNAAKRLQERSVGPWTRWRTRSRHARAIRFIETYCRPPKGVGYGRPLQLAPFQKEWLEDALADGVDVAVQSVPRGNGKSTFRAGVACWAVFDDTGTGAPQVPIVATTVGQAMKSIYTPACQMIQAEPELRRRSIPFTAWGSTRLWVPSTDGEMFPVSNDVDTLQGLDPSVGIVDELAFMPVESWVALTESTGKRDRSLIAGISTPGLSRDNALWDLRRKWTSGVTMPGTRYSEYAAEEGCELEDEDQWRRANPAIAAGFLRIEALRSSVARTPEAMFRIFRLGQWVDGVECWLGNDGRATWQRLADPFELVAGAPTWVGVDVGIKRDSTAVIVGQHRPDRRIHARARLWIPSAEEPVDVTDVMHYLRQLDRVFDLQAIAYDARFFDVPAKILEDEGLPMIEIPQTVERMTPAVGSLYELIRRAELSHDGDPAFTAQVLNAVARFNERGFTLAKAKSRGRIDATVATALMVDLALRFEKAVELEPQVFFG
jgi:phage terminase large subunit-like protein